MAGCAWTVHFYNTFMDILPVVVCIVQGVDNNIKRYYIFGDILPLEVRLDSGIWHYFVTPNVC